MKLHALLLSVLLLFPMAAVADHLCCPRPGSLSFTTSLAGMQLGGTQGSPAGFGRGFVTLDPQRNQVTLRAHAAGLAGEVSGASIFERGITQPFLTFTDAENTFDEFGSFERTITVTPAQMAMLVADPGRFDFAVTTPGFPVGAVRGPLVNLHSLRGTFSGRSVIGSTGAVTAGGGLNAFITPGTGGGSNLNFSFTPTGIGNDITALELRQGAAGINGPLVATLAQNAALTNGRLTGSVPIDAATARELQTNPQNFHIVANTPQFQSGAARAQFGATHTELFFPVVGSLRGVGATQWETDLRIFNASHDRTATVTIEFFPAGQNNLGANGTPNPANVTVVTISPRNVRVFDDALSTLFGVQTTSGALRITSDQPLAATGRVFNDQRPAGRGTIGQTIDALTICHASSRGIIPGVAGALSAGTNIPLRTNVGLFNPTAQTVTVRFDIRGEAGRSVGNRTTALAPFAQMQMPLFGPAGLFPDATADVPSGAISFEASAPIFVYASVIDNTSGDSNLILPVEDTAPVQ